MAQTQVQIISTALNLLGKASITTLSNPTEITQAALNFYSQLIAAEFETGTWRFTTTIVQLTNLNTPPTGGYWLYQYSLPADFKKVIHVWPFTWDYEIYEGAAGTVLYTNYNDATNPFYLEYQNTADVARFPDSFCKFVSYDIATNLALSNAQHAQFWQVLSSQRDYYRAVAMAADAQNRPQTPLQSQPMINNRYVSTLASG